MSIYYQEAGRLPRTKIGLASISSAAENDFVANKMAGGNRAFIGGAKINGKEGAERWIWVDGTKWGYTNWYKGEPNNWKGNGENVLVINHFGQRKWNDGINSNSNKEKFTYVCQYLDINQFSS